MQIRKVLYCNIVDIRLLKNRHIYNIRTKHPIWCINTNNLLVYMLHCRKNEVFHKRFLLPKQVTANRCSVVYSFSSSFIFFIDELESVERAFPLSAISTSLSETLSSSDDVFSEFSESFLVIDAGSMLVLPEKWCYICFNFSDFFTFLRYSME